jgi:hypothetical protein
MPKFCSASNPAKPVLARLSAIHSLKNYPYFHAEIDYIWAVTSVIPAQAGIQVFLTLQYE